MEISLAVCGRFKASSIYTCMCQFGSGQHRSSQSEHLLFLVLIPVSFPFYGTGRDAVCLG
jgi:hypothetical protein